MPNYTDAPAPMDRPTGLSPNTERFYVTNPNNGQPQRLDASGPVRSLKCACCGAFAGNWRQFPNQDNGWGLCARCAAWIERKESADYVTWCYGVAGVHREGPDGATVPTDDETEVQP